MSRPAAIKTCMHADLINYLEQVKYIIEIYMITAIQE